MVLSQLALAQTSAITQYTGPNDHYAIDTASNNTAKVIRFENGRFVVALKERMANKDSAVVSMASFNSCLKQEWGKKLTLKDVSELELKKVDSQTFFLAIGPDLPGIEVYKMNTSGQFIWRKNVQTKRTNENAYDFHTYVTPQGALILGLPQLILGSGGFYNPFTITKLVGNGTVKWETTFRLSGTLHMDFDITQHKDSSFLVYDQTTNYLYQLDQQGQFKKRTQLTPNKGDLRIYDMDVGKQGHIYIMGDLTEGSNPSPCVIKLDSSGSKTRWARQIKQQGEFVDATTKLNNNITLIHRDAQPYSAFNMTQITADGEFSQSNQYPDYIPLGNFTNYGGSVWAVKDSGLTIPAANNGLLHVIQTNENGQTACNSQPTTLKLDTLKVATAVENHVQYATGEPRIAISHKKWETFNINQTVICSASPYPVADLGPDTVICNADSHVLAAGTDTNRFQYQWNTGATTPSITIDSSGKYRLAVTGASCKTRDTVHVQFLNKHKATLGKDTTLCRYEVLPINVDQTDHQFLWQTPGMDSLSEAKTINSLDQNLEKPGTYRLYHQQFTQCPMDTLQLSQYQAPRTDVPDSLAICPYDSIELTPGLQDGKRYHWEKADSVYADSAKAIFWEEGTYQLKHDTTQCAVDTVVLNHHALPQAKAGPDTMLCHDQVYTMQGGGGITYQWIPAKYLSSDTIAQPKADPPQKQFYKLIVGNKQGCQDTSGVMLDVHPPLKVDLDAPGTVCEGEPITLKARTNGGLPNRYKVAWPELQKQGKSITTTLQQDQQVQVKLTDQCSSPASDSLTIQTKPSPEAEIQVKPSDSIYVGDTFYFQSRSTNAQHLRWQLGDGSRFRNETTIAKAYDKRGVREVKLFTGRQNECTDTAIQKVHVLENYQVFIPNAFSPDGNGTNDVWRISGQGIDSYQFKIYNRWGQLVKTSKAGDQAGWEGEFKQSNTLVPEGTYLYTLEVIDQKGRSHFYQGNVEVIK